jgi:AP-4 complex subunit mu-1
MVFNSSGYVLNSGLSGCIQMKSYLWNNPELRLSLNENLIIGENTLKSNYN